MPRPSQDGLVWEKTTFDVVPQWTREPSMHAIEGVCRKQLAIPSEDPFNIAYHASGLFNKLYLVTYDKYTLMMRVSLPVYPRRKTRSEVATLRWVRKNTNIPVPEVFGFDDSNDNEIGYEWILMEFMQGTSAYKRWRTMTMEQKATLTKQVATFQAELSGVGKPSETFRGIGTLDLQPVDANSNDAVETLEKVVPSHLMSYEFFVGDHLGYDVPRGPFRSSYDWLSAHLHIILLHQTAVLEKSEDEGDREDAEDALLAARKLLALLPRFFPPTLNEVERTGLYHHDLHLNNILVNEEGEITTVLDWECVSALPLWASTQVPKFLDEPVREEEPQRSIYADETAEEAAAQNHDDPDYLDNEGKNSLYFIHRMEYEATQLRKVYEAQLKELWQEWPLEGSEAKVEFLQAVMQCDGIWVRKVGRWAASTETGVDVRLEDA